MQDIAKQIESCQVIPLTPESVSVEECKQDDPIMGFIGLIISVISFFVLILIMANADDPPGIWWLVPFVAPFFIYKWFVQSQQQKSAQKSRRELNKWNMEQSEKEGLAATFSAKKCVLSSIEQIGELNVLSCNIADTNAHANGAFQRKNYSLFWDLVKQNLELCDECVSLLSQLASNAESYVKVLSGRVHDFPVYPIKMEHIPEFKKLSAELDAIIDLGQTDFEFATIYEQRRNRDLIVNGTKNLDEAIARFSSELAMKRDKLKKELDRTVEQTRRK